MIIIIGGGIFGLAIGWSLAQAGCPVTLFERDQVGQGATGVAVGMLMPWKLSNSFNQDLFLLQWESHKRWPEFVRAVEAASEREIGYQTDGRYFVALDEKAGKRLRKQYQFHAEEGFLLEWLSGDEVRRREPALGPQVRAAIYSPMGHRVESRQVIEALQRAFRRAGGSLREQTPVREILSRGDQVRGVRLDGETVAAETVILAAGAWSGQIEGLPSSLRALIQPLKGQILTLQMDASRPLLHQPVIGPVYLVPWPDHTLVLGTTVEEEAGFETEPTVEGVLDILSKAQEIVPGIKELPIRKMMAGLRPTGPDRLPVLGATPIRGLIMASGGHSYGILLSPIVAETMTRLVLTGEIESLIKPFTLQSTLD